MALPAGLRKSAQLSDGLGADSDEARVNTSTETSANAEDGLSGDFVLEAGAHRAVVDSGLARALSEVQRAGLVWMYAAVHGELRGCILADGMGVGKTLQVLALVHTLVATGQAARVLIAVPSSLVHNWHVEVCKFATPPRVGLALPVTYVGSEPLQGDGAGAQCDHARRALWQLQIASSAAPRVVVCSYPQLLVHGPAFIANGGCVDLLVGDEAHSLKGEMTHTTRTFAAISAGARVLITATPQQNRFEIRECSRISGERRRGQRRR